MKSAILRLAVLMVVSRTFSASGGEAAGPEISSVRILHAAPNPTGLQTGFWANYRRQGQVLEDFGRRPAGRVDFSHWSRFETARGVYQWDGKFENIRNSHRHGETVIAAINVSFSPEINKNKPSIPSFYPPRITHPETRAAAKRFLAAYTERLLQEAGGVWLGIDYEIIYNYRLYTPADLARANEWRDWYLEAADTVREAARAAGHAGAIRLVPIFNGNPFKEGSLMAAGRDGNPWMVDVVNASDALGLDTYHMGPAVSPADPSGTLETIRFYVDQFAGGKEVMVCENGFSSVTEHNPRIDHTQKGKYAGTEEQQRAYYEALFAGLEKANQPGGMFHNRLRAFNIWCYMDNHTDRKGDFETWFGLVRRDRSPKPAFAAVKEGIDHLERDPFHRPSSATVVAEFPDPAAACGREFLYTSGTEHDFIGLAVRLPAGCPRVVLETTTRFPGCVLAGVNGVWTAADTVGTEHALELVRGLRPGGENEIAVCFTGGVFPFRQQLVRLSLR